MDEKTASTLTGDSSMRVMLYCAAEPQLGPYVMSDISFPQQLEVKVNGREVKAAFKGLKNKPGSTKPVDITSFLELRRGYPNSLQIMYALTFKVCSPG